MRHAVTGTKLAFSFVLLLAGPALTQALSDEATPWAKAAAPVAHVYVQTTKGINAYDAAANGKLTLIKGSPFQAPGTWMEASNGKYLFSSDGYRIHTFVIKSDGAIGNQLAEIDTQDFDGADCSGSLSTTATFNAGAVLDHTGKSLYQQIWGYAEVEGGTSVVCSAYQSYQVSASGKLTFNGAYVWSSTCCDDDQNPTFTGSDHFVYGLNWGAGPAIHYFVREPNGALSNFNGSAEAPPPPPSSTPFGDASWTWQPNLVEADPFGHIAMMGIFTGDTPQGSISSDRKLVAYTVESNGDLVTSNTYAEFATPAVYPLTLNMSPSGKLLAVAGEGQGQGGALQIFHFNGAAPITPYSEALTDASEIYRIHWDNNNHLFAIDTNNRLWVYTITETEITQAPGSPYSFDGASNGEGLIVVPTL
jgi:hypothetical protein